MGTTHCRLLGGSKDTKQIWSAAEYAVAMEHLKTSAHYSSALPLYNRNSCTAAFET